MLFLSSMHREHDKAPTIRIGSLPLAGMKTLIMAVEVGHHYRKQLLKRVPQSRRLIVPSNKRDNGRVDRLRTARR